VITIGSGGPADFVVPVPAIAQWAATHDIAHPCRLLHPDTLAGAVTVQLWPALIVATPAKSPAVWEMSPVHDAAVVHEIDSSTFAPGKDKAYGAVQRP
jgi:hypothetical protein